MGELPNFLGDSIKKEIVPKDEDLDFELPPETIFPRQHLENGASSSGSNMRSLFIGMGFLPSLVDRVLEEKGEDLGEGSVDLLLETLIGYSGPTRSKSESSDSLDRLFDEHDTGGPEVSKPQPKEEDDLSSVVGQKRASLRMMNFSRDEIEFAISKLGEHAGMDEMVDFIVASQISKRFNKTDGTTDSPGGKDEDISDETLFGTMEKALRLLEMGFTENEISTAFERFGVNVSIAELADFIFALRCGEVDKYNNYPSTALVEVKSEDYTGDNAASGSSLVLFEDTIQGKRPKEEYPCDDFSESIARSSHLDFRAGRRGKKLKHDLIGGSSSIVRSPLVEEEEEDTKSTGIVRPVFRASPSSGVSQLAAKPPFFFYGSVVNISQDWWGKISQFLYTQQPEFVNTQLFSAISRKEGYVHNLPTGNRSHILPRSPMTIEEAIPHTKKWWPSWDTRKQLSCISSETSGSSLLCERFGRVLTQSRGLPSPEQQRDILRHCRDLNLIWVGPRKLGPIEPEYLETILGYPVNHTKSVESSERLEALKHCFQTDTLGYHLSVFKSMFPGGLTVLSLFTGIGGAEVALHRLGVPLKAVVSVENSEVKRKILKLWWSRTGQTGDLVQIEDIQRLSTNRLETLINKFGGFDLVICQNPCIVSSKSKAPAEGNNLPGFNFSMFYEFVRVLQRVRDSMERKR